MRKLHKYWFKISLRMAICLIALCPRFPEWSCFLYAPKPLPSVGRGSSSERHWGLRSSRSWTQLHLTRCPLPSSSLASNTLSFPHSSHSIPLEMCCPRWYPLPTCDYRVSPWNVASSNSDVLLVSNAHRIFKT